MQATSLAQVKTIIKVCYRAKRPLFLIGSPGIGKSDTVKAAAEELGKEMFNEDWQKFRLLDFRLAQMDPADIRGIPFPGEDKRTHWSPPDILPSDGSGILFLDEFNLSPPSVQNASYELILDRRLGSYHLPDGYFCIAAGNNRGEGAVSELKPALRNRFVWVEVPPPSLDEWQIWASNHNVHPTIMAFLHFKSGHCLFKYDRKEKASAFPTPRTWFFASELLWQVSDEDGYIQDFDMGGALAESAVGPYGAEFIGFAKLQKEVDLEAFWKNPAKEAIPTDVSMKYALITAVGHRVRALTEKAKAKDVDAKTIAPWTILAKRLVDMDQTEMAVLGLRIGKTQRSCALLGHDPVWATPKTGLGARLGKYLVQ